LFGVGFAITEPVEIANTVLGGITKQNGGVWDALEASSITGGGVGKKGPELAQKGVDQKFSRHFLAFFDVLFTFFFAFDASFDPKYKQNSEEYQYGQ